MNPRGDLTIGSLFTGYGGLDRAAEIVTGARTVWVSDNNPAAAKILEHTATCLPNLGDVTRIDWNNVAPVDILTGGFPCQDVSMAGRRAGLRPGTRSGLWSTMCNAIDHLRPSLVIAENVRGLLSAATDSDLEPCPGCMGNGHTKPMRALGAVLADLADIGYDAAWYGLTAASIGAPHLRYRIFITAWPTTDTRGEAEHIRARLRPRVEGRIRRGRPDNDDGTPATPDTDSIRRGEIRRSSGERSHPDRCDRTHRDGHPTEPPSQWGKYAAAIGHWERIIGRPAPAAIEVGSKGGQRLSPGFVEWMMGLPQGHVTDVDITINDQLKALGNGVVPQQAEAAIRRLLPVMLGE